MQCSDERGVIRDLTLKFLGMEHSTVDVAGHVWLEEEGNLSLVHIIIKEDYLHCFTRLS